eukprot:TRINITY_DN3814_c0_g1_i1.p1 TRINITY_DN3814_c0_g1~~TRINITY_DN3814_c0_g1_i1.p1  ORF type:complete len:670 (-),score=190.64 TRINITY_DN3814_c0_g1_i1:50-2059(-)
MEIPKSISQLQTAIETSFISTLSELGAKPIPSNQFSRLISPTKTPGFDLQLVCFPFAKSANKKPEVLATEVAEKLNGKSEIFSRVAADKAYVNFVVSTKVLATSVIGEFFFPQPEPSLDNAQPTLIEFSSPNTNKPQHLGHVRNNCLGDSISRLIKHTGNKLVKVNLINDRGVHICKSMLAYKKFGKGETPESSGIKGDHLVGNYYVEFEKELQKGYKEWLTTEVAQNEFAKWKASESGKKALAKNESAKKKLEKEKNEEEKAKQLALIPNDFETFKSEYKTYYTNNFSDIGIEANKMLVDWEAGDKEVHKLWNTMNGWVFKGFDETYARYGIKFDSIEKESEIYLKGKEIVLQNLEKGLLEKLESGSIACDLVKIGVLKKGSGEKADKKVLLRANGTSVYMTQDLGTAASRLEKYKPKKMIYVVASEQDRHFAILFKLIESLYPESKGNLYHLSYGMVNLPTGRMKSREGTVVDADDLVDGLSEMARVVTKEKWPQLTEEQVKFRADKIAMAAIKYYILSFGPATTVTFDPASSLQFKGKAGPYILYQYARTRSILTKCNLTLDQVGFKPECLVKLGTEEEQTLLKVLYTFNKEVQFAVDTHDPSKVCDVIYEIAKEFNTWYKLKEKHQVVNCEDPDLKDARLMLAVAVGSALKRGLDLLGIEPLEQM